MRRRRCAAARLGRREAALTAAEEAVALWRELAAQRPDAFRPDLATSLAVRANCLEALDRCEDALAGNADAIATLSPAFVQHPAAFAHWMLPMIQQYERRCEHLNRKPDAALFGPELMEKVMEMLQQRHSAAREQSE